MPAAIDLNTKELWLPGRGMMPAHVRQAVEAVREYDPDLGLARHDASGEWVVTLQRGTPEAHPVFGLGTELPPVEEIKRRLYQGDVRRHGGELAVKLQKAQDMRQKHLRDEVNDQTGVAAEALEWALRKEGRTSHSTHYIPKGVKS